MNESDEKECKICGSISSMHNECKVCHAISCTECLLLHDNKCIDCNTIYEHIHEISLLSLDIE